MWGSYITGGIDGFRPAKFDGRLEAKIPDRRLRIRHSEVFGDAGEIAGGMALHWPTGSLDHLADLPPGILTGNDAMQRRICCNCAAQKAEGKHKRGQSPHTEEHEMRRGIDKDGQDNLRWEADPENCNAIPFTKTFPWSG